MRHLLTSILLFSISISFAQWNPNAEKEKRIWKTNFQKAQFDNPDLAAEFEYKKTKDPALNTVPSDRLFKAMDYTKNLIQTHTAIDAVEWIERGPKNVSGRTRAIMFDPNYATNNKVWAAGITGGLWYNLDINNGGEWINIGSFWENIAVSSLAYDPSNPSNFYAGTGEGWTEKSVRGAGIWKSTDAGANWTRLSSTENGDFYNIQKIVITNNGRIIASTNSGLFISDDDGNSWIEAIDDFFGDIEITTNGTIFASQGKRNTAGTVYRSINNGDNWTDLAITTDPTERTEIASAPSEPNTIYAVSSVARNVSWFKKSTDNGDSWIDITIPMYLDQGNCTESTNDFTRGQAWYDLIMMVNPQDENMVYVGGIDWHKTTDGGTNWESVSYWTGSCAEYVHADQHAMIFFPEDNSKALVGCDGGVFLINDMQNGFTTEAHLNNNYNVTQFYGCAMENIAGSNYMLAGAQDNGTQKFTQVGFGSTTEATGGDGGFCFIDQDDSQIQITSYVYNNWRLSDNGGNSFFYYPSTSNGLFINPGDYDSEANVLYASSSDPDTIFVSNIMVDGNNGNYLPIINGIEGGVISTIKVSPYSENVIYIGTTSGKIFRITDAIINPTSTNIDLIASLPMGYISSIDLGEDENKILLTYSNYGIESVWQTIDAGVNWTSIEYNLPDMPIRGCLYNPNNTNQILLATETGVWSMNDISTETNWEPSNSGLANVRCDQLKYRTSDKMVAVATYGRGLFTSDVFADPEPAAYFEANTTVSCPTDTVFFTDLSTKSPSQWNWTISPATFDFLSGTDANSQNPIIQFNEAGSYTIELTAANASGSGTITKTDYILVNEDCHYIITDGVEYVCDGVFYDSGYDEDYSNGQDYVMTLYPIYEDYLMVSFTSFNIEYHEDCGYDYLSIYNGTSTNAPLIGKYCGGNSPGNIVAENDPSGALTFKFHSDGGAVAFGWTANIMCFSVDIDEVQKEKFRVYPNPAKNFINIESDNSKKQSEILIYDLMGKLIYNSTFTAEKRINTSHLKSGMYILKIKSDKNINQQTIVIE